MVQTIVVPLDGSDRAEGAIPWAVELARLTGQSVTLLQVLPWKSESSPQAGAGTGSWLDIPETLRAELRDAAFRYLGRLRHELESQGIRSRAELANGDVASAILDVADERGASTIVIASHGHGGLTRFMIGSVAQRISRQSLIPTLIVRTGAHTAGDVSFARVLVPLDGSSLAESGLELLDDVAGRETEVVLARVVEPVRVPIGSSAELGSVIDWNSTGLASKQAETYLNEKARALEHAGFRAEAIVRTGVPGEELTNVAKEWKVSLVVMATHGRTGLDRFMLGSTADAMIRHGGPPVLLINAHAVYGRMLEPYSVHEVMTAEATPLRSDESISIAITKLLRRGQSSAPVVDGEGALVGVISEHDLLGWHAQYVDALSRDETKLDPAAYCMQLEQDVVASIMTREVIPVESDAHLSAAVDLLLKHDLQNLPVTKDGQVVGMLDRLDALQALRARQAQLSANKI